MSGKNNNSPTVPAAYMESDTGNAPLGKKKIKGRAPRVDIHIHSYRKRLADADGVSAKAAIDGIVKAGLLKDDSPEFVEQVRYAQEKADEEKTVITVTFLPIMPEGKR